MSVSVIIPSYKEEQWLNRTIDNIYSTATGEIQVIVVQNGDWHPVDSRAKVIRLPENEGERVAMNLAANVAMGTHLLRIDAHCDFSPKGWDQMMEEVTGPRDMTQAVLTAVDKSWKRIPGHRYERCRLLPNFEAKWETPNQNDGLDNVEIGLHGKIAPRVDGSGPRAFFDEDDDIQFQQVQNAILPNMSSTGCGFMIRKEFYDLIGGADESYPKMGAIGEEFSVKTWMHGGKVQTRTDVIIGHIFGTGGYDTGGVVETRRRLVETWGHRYGEIRDKFPDLDWSEDLRPTAIHSGEKRSTVTVTRTDTETFKDGNDRVCGQEVRTYVYLWLAKSHPDELDWTDDQIRKKYAPGANVLYSLQTLVANKEGVLVEQEAGNSSSTTLCHCPTCGELSKPKVGFEACNCHEIPADHYKIPAPRLHSTSPLTRSERPKLTRQESNK